MKDGAGTMMAYNKLMFGKCARDLGVFTNNKEGDQISGSKLFGLSFRCIKD